MKKPEICYQNPAEDLLNNQSITKALSKKQTEFVRLLQNKEILIEAEKSILITCGKKIKKVPLLTFYSLINKGLICRQAEWPFNYLLSAAGKEIIV